MAPVAAQENYQERSVAGGSVRSTTLQSQGARAVGLKASQFRQSHTIEQIPHNYSTAQNYRANRGEAAENLAEQILSYRDEDNNTFAQKNISLGNPPVEDHKYQTEIEDNNNTGKKRELFQNDDEEEKI